MKAREEKSDSAPEAKLDVERGSEIGSSSETPAPDREGNHPRLARVHESGGAGAGDVPLASRVSDFGRGESGGDSNEGLALGIPSPGQAGAGPEYGRYLARLRQMIQDALHYPAAARRRSLAGTVQMEIVIFPTGTVGQVSVLHSSSHRILDEAAVEAVRSLPPLPFPAELPPRTLRVRVPVVFELR